MPGFLTVGMTIACFIIDGKVADSSEELTSFINIATIVRPEAFTSQVGTGSRAHCLLGHRLSNRWMSVLYDARLVLHVWSADGGEAPSVDAWMVSTLPMKCLTNSGGVIDVVYVVGGDIKPDSAFHSSLVSPALSITRPLQYDRSLLLSI